MSPDTQVIPLIPDHLLWSWFQAFSKSSNFKHPKSHKTLTFVSTEKRQDNGRIYFVNHNTRTTQWDDPRTQGWDLDYRKTTNLDVW